MPVEQDDPDTTAADVEQVAARAREVLAGPYRLTAPQAVLEVTPAELAPLLSAEVRDGSLVLAVQDQQLRELVVPRADALDRAASPASFEIAEAPPVVDTQGDLTWTPRPAPVTVRPATPGLDVDAEAAAQRLLELIDGPEREAELPAAVTPSSIPTEQAAGVRSLLGTFTTSFTPGQPRAANIRRIAEVLDGTFVPPGERLSLNQVAGPRTAAKGYLADGAIVDGELVDVVGGGVSQFATTLFNAAFFAGLPIEEHQPHSFYISRYPAGRESTVNYGSIDVKVRNDTSTGLLVKTSSTSSSVTVALYGDNGGRTVTSSSGPREPREGGGFRISVTRTVTGGDGRGGTRTFRTSYNPPPD
jgi:vancomycin resistance protein YoaR